MNLLVVILTAAQGMSAGAEQCGTCHPDVRVLFERSIHAREQIVCTDCHGGDPGTLEVERAHRGSFVARPARKDVPALCASCHSDIARMRPYNLPADQYALYQTSRHGQLLALGDDRVAVCTDCHGVHDILSPRNSDSRVAHQNIPQTCGACHSDTDLMKRYGKDGDPAADYLRSVHARALLEEGNLHAPECSRCHGVHGATPPGVGDVDKICGSCHEASRNNFLEGPHGAAIRKAGDPKCSTCHGNHAIESAGLDLIDSVCTECHDTAGAEVELGRKLKALYASADVELQSAAALVARAETVPLDVEDYQARLEEARTYLGEVLPVFHSLSIERVERLTRRAQSIGKEIASELYEKLRGRRFIRFGLIVFWFYVLLTVGLLIRGRRRSERGAPP